MPSAASRERPAGLDDALESLERASITPARQRTIKVSGVVDIVCRHAFDEGLDEEALRAIILIVTRKSELDQTSVTTLLKNCYPAQRVPADVVLAVVGALGQGKGKPSPGTQNGLVKWLTIVHEIIEDPNVLSRLYGVLFAMLDMISIRTSLCHLLSLITRRKHVKPFRIQSLLELSRGLGNEPALQGLLRIYKDYYPDIILGGASTSRNSFAPRPDPEWRTRLLAIQVRTDSASESGFDQHNGFKVLRKGPKRIKASIIPDVHTYQTNEASITLEGIDNVDDFVEKLDRIEPPGQLISILTDPLLQKYVDLNSSPIIRRRIELWLSTCLEEQYNAVKDGRVDAPYLSEVLEGLLMYAQYTKTLPPVVHAFLREYLLIWDGLQDIDSILGLVSFTPIQPFQDAYATFLRPAERALTSQNPDAYDHLLRFYTALLRRWMSQIAPQPAQPKQVFESPNQRSLLDLVTHVSELSTSLLLSGASVSLISSILAFYELLSHSAHPFHIPIIQPPNYLLYLLILSPSTNAVSRTVGLVGAYKRAFNVHPVPIKHYYPQDEIDSLNCALRDIFHVLWSGKGLVVANNPDGTPLALGFHCAPTVRETLQEYLLQIDDQYRIGTTLNLAYNPWLASISAAVWREIEEGEVMSKGYDRQELNWHQGPVNQRSLEALSKSGGVSIEWDEYRVGVLKWLADRGSAGIRDFIFASSDALRKKYAEE